MRALAVLGLVQIFTQHKDNGENRERQEHHRVKLKSGAVQKGQPRQIAGTEPEQNQTGCSVASSNPVDGKRHQRKNPEPPDGRVAESGDCTRASAWILTQRPRGGVCRAKGRAFVEERGWAKHEQPAERVGLVIVRRGEADVKAIGLQVIVPEGLQRRGQPLESLGKFHLGRIEVSVIAARGH